MINVPSLKERKEDIPILVDHFSEMISAQNGTAKRIFTKGAIDLLSSYEWTGNIRELRNVVERLLILGEEVISENDVKTFANK